MSESIPPNAGVASGPAAVERSQALAAARRRASQTALDNARAAEAQRADSRQDVRAILERAVGANTRLSVSRNENAQTFIYRAVDVDTGEVVREWPPVDFARFLAANGLEIGVGELTGAVLNEQA